MDEILGKFKVVVNGEPFNVWRIIIGTASIECITPIPFVDFDNACIDLYFGQDLILDYKFSDFEVHPSSIVLNFEKIDI